MVPILLFMVFQLLLVEVWGSIAQLHCTFVWNTSPVSVHIYIYVYVYIYSCAYLHVCLYVKIGIYVHLCIWIYVYMKKRYT